MSVYEDEITLKKVGSKSWFFEVIHEKYKFLTIKNSSFPLFKSTVIES